MVMPSGTPADTNPMNRGTALQEQKGVATPRPAAARFPRPCRRPPEQGPGALGGDEGAQHRGGEDHRGEQQQDLPGVEEEEVHRIAQAAVEADEVEDQAVPHHLVGDEEAGPHRRSGSHPGPGPQRQCPRGRPGRRSPGLSTGHGPAQRLEGLRHQAVVHPPAAAPGSDQAGAPQHRQVIGEQVGRHSRNPAATRTRSARRRRPGGPGCRGGSDRRGRRTRPPSLQETSNQDRLK